MLQNYRTVPTNPTISIQNMQKAWKNTKNTKKTKLQEFWLITAPSSQDSWRFVFFGIFGTLPCFLHDLNWYFCFCWYSSIVLHHFCWKCLFSIVKQQFHREGKGCWLDWPAVWPKLLEIFFFVFVGTLPCFLHHLNW